MFKFGVDSEDELENSIEAPSLSTQNAAALPRARFVHVERSRDGYESEIYDQVEFCNGKVLLKKTPWAQMDHADDNHDDRDSNEKEGFGEVVEGIYEGGAKLWECAGDLVSYMAEMDNAFEGKRILELGGGHALPAIYAAMHGAKEVDVQDLNEVVLQKVTAKNFSMNLDHGTMCTCTVRYIAGEWKGLRELLKEVDPYDFILSTETTYREADLMPLASCILQSLKRGSGVALIAAKSYYFGTGGGLRLFEDALQRHADSSKIIVDVKSVREFRDGISNVREILRISVRE